MRTRAVRAFIVAALAAPLSASPAVAAPSSPPDPASSAVTASQPPPDARTSTSDQVSSGFGGTIPGLDRRLASSLDDRDGARDGSGGTRDEAAAEERIETYSTSRPVAPGVVLRSFDRYGPDLYTGEPTWLQADSLTVDLTKGTKVDYLFPGRVADGAPISEQADRAGAVAAVNGDFFDINQSNAPLGVGIKDGEVIQSPDPSGDWNGSAAIFTPDGLGSIGEVFFQGTIVLPDGELPLAGLNKPELPVDGVEAFTPVWGTYCRCRAVQDATDVTEVEVVDHTVTAVRDAAGEGEIPENGFVLVGREAGAERLAALEVGDTVRIDYAARTAEGARIQAAVNGRQLLVVDGEPQKASEADNVPPAPRTAVGFSKDGRTMYLLTVDGRQPAFATGVGLDELAEMMVELGAYNALNLDGGGSTTMVARKPGGTSVEVENSPSDGAERRDPNGLALFAPEGSGKVRGFWVEPVLDPSTAPGSSEVALARPDRVFSGFTRRLSAAAYDETYGPASAEPRWRADPRIGTVDEDGVFHAHARGTDHVTGRVTAFRGRARGATELTVLGPPTRIAPTADRLTLTGKDDNATFGVLGYDRTGTSAPFEPEEIAVEYDETLLDIAPREDGRFTVTARQVSGSTLVTVRVGDLTAVLPVTVGLEEVVVSDFEDASAWEFFGERATGSVESAPGKEGNGLRLRYDFTASAETRTGGAVPKEPLEIPGRPRALRLWVKSSGQGEWASLQVYDADGALLPAFRGGYLTEEGWQQVEFPVPAGTRYPLTLRRYYSAETRADRRYQGDIVLDRLTALVPPALEDPPREQVTDPVVVRDGSVAGADLTFAVMSDAQFVAREPDSALVRQTRRTLREIRAAGPDLLLINGDLVDEASEADFAFARRILDEELEGALPYFYVPGNHERSAGTLDAFRAAFGETQQVFDRKGTRFVLMDSSGLSLRASDWRQLGLLGERLEDAARDRSIHTVVVVQHVPPQDPTPARASELADRKEAATIERRLGEFVRESGKGAAFIGAHVGTFHASRVDGVPYVVNGNAGKTPSTRPDEGGFTGWSLWGIDRRGATGQGDDRIRVELRPHVDALTLTAPDEVVAGSTAHVRAAVEQSDRTVPVAYPVSADWSGSPNLHIGPVSGLRPWHDAWFDPRSNTLRALRPGRIVLAVTVNGVTARAEVRLAARAAA